MKKRLLAIFLSIALMLSLSPVGSSYAAYSDDYSYIIGKLGDLSTKENSMLLSLVMAMVQHDYGDEIDLALSKLTDDEKQLLEENGFDKAAIQDVFLAFSQVMDPDSEDEYRSGYDGESMLVLVNKIKDGGDNLDEYKQELVTVYEFMFDALPDEVVEQDFSGYGSRMDKARVFRDVLKSVYDEGDICARYYEKDSRFELVLPSDFISKANDALDVSGVEKPIELTQDHAGAIGAFLDVLSQKINATSKYAEDAKALADKLGLLETVTGTVDKVVDVLKDEPKEVVFGEGSTAKTIELDFSNFTGISGPVKVEMSNVEGEIDLGAGMEPAGPVIDFELNPKPTGGTARIGIELDSTASTSKSAIYYYNPETGKWEKQEEGSEVKDGIAYATVSHFSIYGVFEDTSSGGGITPPIPPVEEDKDAPTEVKVSASKVTDSSVTLSLSAKDESGIAKYYIYRDGVAVGTSTSSSYTDSGLQPDTTYKYKIMAEDTKGNKSDFSSQVSVKTEKEEAPEPEDKEAPTDVKVSASKVTDSSVTLSLSAKDDSGIEKYYIYRDGKEIKQTAAGTYEDNGLQAETEYSYNIKAQDKAGNMSGFSSQIKVTTLKKGETPQDKEAPTDVKVTLKKKDDDTVYLNLSAKDESGIAKYHIYRDGKKVGTSAKDTYKDEDLKADTKYTYKVKAEDTKGNVSDFSSELSVTTDKASSGGGGGGGSSSGDSDETDDKDSINKKEDKDKVEVEDKIDEDAIKKEEKDGKTEVVIDGDKLEKEVDKIVDAIDDIKTEKGQEKGGKIVVDLGKVNSENSHISIPVKAIEKAKGKGVEVVFRANDIEVSLPADNLVQKADSVKLEIKEIKQTQDMMDKIQKSLEPGMKAPKVAKIVSFELYKVDAGKEEKIDSSFKKKVKVQIDISDMNVDKDNAVLVFVDDEGKMTIVGRKVVDGKIVAELEHFSYYAVVERDVELSDVSGHWAKDYIFSMACKDIVSGYEDGSFRPENSVTRAEFAKLIVEEMELEIESPSGRFSDSNGHWAEGFIETAYKNGILSGYEDGTVRPDEKITRAEMAVMISRATGEDSDGKSVNFKDEGIIPNWAKSGVEKAAKQGLMKGDPNMNFNPGSSTTRAQAATVIYRLFNKQA
ncbi:Chitodextrinase [Peptoclostridium litorale DSM 5388]|uniref:Amylopullulanase AmyB n=1 Tax=Peptoclostridium litorale DSM 5388 TaxID=1121324 RepID=A0A069RC93_PEPLI|nr:S-layer homology domain-containing protein [Peptoclostridium litorale]KDR94664.1 amylopullulanase AmyB [Peptoclostridium litorale DSM 5388]SIO30068.1 Chitodextrinase [Peptoclostridium litorale DSM 5388]